MWNRELFNKKPFIKFRAHYKAYRHCGLVWILCTHSITIFPAVMLEREKPKHNQVDLMLRITEYNIIASGIIGI